MSASTAMRTAPSRPRLSIATWALCRDREPKVSIAIETLYRDREPEFSIVTETKFSIATEKPK